MPLNRLDELAPRYLWLADQGFVEVDKSTEYNGNRHHVVHMVGPDFTIKVEFDPLGPLAWIGSESMGWNQLCWVIQIVSPEALPDFPKGGLDRDAEALGLKNNLNAVTDLYRHGDLEELSHEVRRRRRADNERLFGPLLLTD